MPIFSKIKTTIIYIFCIFLLIMTLGNFINLGKVSDKKIKFGLDLKGGKELLIQVDSKFYIEEKLSEIIDELKDNFKKEKIKALPEFLKEENKIQIIFKRESDENKINKIVKQLNKKLETKTKEQTIYITLKNLEVIKIEKELIKKSIKVLNRRLSKFGENTFFVQKADKNHILIQTSNEENFDEVKKTIQKTAKLTFNLVNKDVQSGVKLKKVKQINSNFEYLVEKKALLSGELLMDAQITYYKGNPSIVFKFNQEGTQKFAKITKENIGKLFAIVLDDEVIMAPRINTTITNGTGMISGNFTEEEATKIAELLKAGALPTSLKVVKEANFESPLNKKLIKNAVNIFITLAIVFILFFFILYKSFGWFINLSIILNMLLITTVLSWFGVVVTFLGMVSLTLSLGVILILNIVIFEEIKTARKSGSRITNSLQRGFKKGLKSIPYFVILGLVFCITYLFGNYSLKSFSLVFIIGVLSSLFVSLLLTKWLIVLGLDKFNLKKVTFRQ